MDLRLDWICQLFASAWLPNGLLCSLPAPRPCALYLYAAALKLLIMLSKSF